MTRPGVTLTDKGEVITSPAFIGRQYGDYPFQQHWREQLQKERPDLWAWIQEKKAKREV